MKPKTPASGKKAGPLYRQVQARLESRIKALPPGSRIETESRLASLYNVSVTTIRQALAELEQRGLIERRQGSGTYVAESPLPAQHVAVLLDGDIASRGLSPYYPAFLQGVRRALMKLGIESRPYLGFQPVGVESSRITCRDLITDVRLGRVMGVISSLASLGEEERRLFRERNIPLVDHTFLDEDGTWPLKSHFIRTALGYLRERGRSRLAILGWESPVDKRFPVTNVLRRHALEYGFDMDRQLIDMSACGWLPGMGWERLRDFWKLNPYKPDALIVVDDSLFADCQQAIMELGIQVPDHLDVVLRASDAFSLNPRFPVLVWKYKVEELTFLYALRLKELLEGLPQSEPEKLPIEVSFESPDLSCKIPDLDLLALKSDFPTKC